MKERVDYEDLKRDPYVVDATGEMMLSLASQSRKAYIELRRDEVIIELYAPGGYREVIRQPDLISALFHALGWLETVTKPTEASDNFITPREAANLLQIPIKTIYSAIERRQLEGTYRANRRLWIRLQELIGWAEEKGLLSNNLLQKVG